MDKSFFFPTLFLLPGPSVIHASRIFTACKRVCIRAKLVFSTMEGLATNWVGKKKNKKNHASVPHRAPPSLTRLPRDLRMRRKSSSRRGSQTDQSAPPWRKPLASPSVSIAACSLRNWLPAHMHLPLAARDIQLGPDCSLPLRERGETGRTAVS